MFTDQGDVDSMFAETTQVVGGADSGLAHQHPRILHEIQHPEGVREVGGHGGEIAVVHAQQRIAGVGEAHVVQDPVEVVDRVHLDERGHAEFGREDLVVDDLPFAQHLRDEQDGIRAGGPRLPDLVLVDDEVLAKHRERNSILDAEDVPEIAPEVVRIGEAGDRGRTARVVA